MVVVLGLLWLRENSFGSMDLCLSFSVIKIDEVWAAAIAYSWWWLGVNSNINISHPLITNK